VKICNFCIQPLLRRAVNWLPRIYNDTLPPWVFCLPLTLSMAHLAPCLTLTGRRCFYSRQSFEIFLLCSVQVTKFQLEYLMHACSSDFVHYWNMKLSPSLIHLGGGPGGRAPPPSPSETGHQTSDQYVQPAMGFPDFSFCFEFSKCLFFWAHLQLFLLR